MVSTRARSCVIAVLLAATAVLAVRCNQTKPSPGVSINKTAFNCPSDTIVVTRPGGFPAGTQITLTNKSSGLTYDGGAFVNQSGQVGGGFPSEAPAGAYSVIVKPPNESTLLADIVDYTKNNCQ